jgi:hypothetical protein
MTIGVSAPRIGKFAGGSDVTTKPFRPGGAKGKLHRELHIPEGRKIPPARLAAATRSADPAIRRDAIRAKTMARWAKPKSRPGIINR